MMKRNCEWCKKHKGCEALKDVSNEIRIGNPYLTFDKVWEVAREEASEDCPDYEKECEDE